MTESWALWSAFAAAGLAGSLHCVGMCGPLVYALHGPDGRAGSTPLHVASHHLGRLWTYATLGFVAGALGDGARQAFAGQRALAVVFGLLVVGNGLWALRRRRFAWEGKAAAGVTRTLLPLLSPGGRRAPALLVGALVGFLPCGLVWSMLIPAAALADPWRSALAMVVFGAGTIPALTSVVVATRWLSPALRRFGRPAVALLLVTAGCFMVFRALRVDPGCPGGCHAGASIFSRPPI